MSDPRARIDLGKAFSFVSSQPGWISKLLLPGILGFIPVVGTVALLGWQRRIVASLRAGSMELPEMDVADDLKGGLAPTLAVLNVGGLMLIGVFIGFLGFLLVEIGEATGNRTVSDLMDAAALLFGLASFTLTFVLGLATFGLMPELLRRGHQGELLPVAHPKESLRAARSHTQLLVTAGLGCVIASALGSLGGVLCGVGLAVTVPWAVAAMGHLVVQWSRVVEGAPPPTQLEGPPPGAIAWTGNR